MPLVAILRGLQNSCALEVGDILTGSGFEILEVPLNSPEPFSSIGTLVKAFGGNAIIGAGTVLETSQVEQLDDIGATLVVSPNCNPKVIGKTAEKGMISLPGVLTPSEMFAALDAGATGLKIFPAELFSPSAIKAVRSVLPAETPIYVVGGISASNMKQYLDAGATGFGIGGSLFKPGKPLNDIAEDAQAIVEAFRIAAGTW